MWSKTEFFEQVIDLSGPVIKPYSFSNYQAYNAKQFYLNMELYSKQLQVGMNSAVAAQLCPSPKMQSYSTGRLQSYNKTKEITV